MRLNQNTKSYTYSYKEDEFQPSDISGEDGHIYRLSNYDEESIKVTIEASVGNLLGAELEGVELKTHESSSSKIVLEGLVKDGNSDKVRLIVKGEEGCKYTLTGTVFVRVTENDSED